MIRALSHRATCAVQASMPARPLVNIHARPRPPAGQPEACSPSRQRAERTTAPSRGRESREGPLAGKCRIVARGVWGWGYKMRARKEGPESYCRAGEERGASEGGRPPATRMGERRPLEGPSQGAGAGARGERGPDQKRSSIVICFMSWRRAREEAQVSICARGDGHGGGGERLTSCRAERVGQGGRGVLDGQPPARRREQAQEPTDRVLDHRRELLKVDLAVPADGASERTGARLKSQL